MGLLHSSYVVCELENMPEVLVYNGKNQPTILETSNLPHIIKHNVSIYNNNSCKNNERVTTTLSSIIPFSLAGNAQLNNIPYLDFQPPQSGVVVAGLVGSYFYKILSD